MRYPGPWAKVKTRALGQPSCPPFVLLLLWDQSSKGMAERTPGGWGRKTKHTPGMASIEVFRHRDWADVLVEH
jgi:hypothetical protein